jgi:hypothetical protein
MLPPNQHDLVTHVSTKMIFGFQWQLLGSWYSHRAEKWPVRETK